MQPGDVFVGNDAYHGGGTHLPDIVLAEPIFVDGTLAAWTVNLAHHSDFADRGHAHIYQEGLRIPPIRLYSAGELQKDVLDLVLLNCQVPRERLSDLRAQMAANRVGVNRFKELCAKNGLDIVLASGEALLDYAERKMRAGIASLPDGVYRFDDVFDNPEFDEALPISVEVAIRGEEISLAFEAPPQVRGGINMTYTALLATVYYVVKIRGGSDDPAECRAGAPDHRDGPQGQRAQLRPSRRRERPGADVPARLGPDRRRPRQGGPRQGHRLHQQHLHRRDLRRHAAGAGRRERSVGLPRDDRRRRRRPRPRADALDGIHVHVTNTSNLPVEALELEYPLTLLRYELVDDSAGAGRFRGGMGLRRVYRANEECLVRARHLAHPLALLGAPGRRRRRRRPHRLRPRRGAVRPRLRQAASGRVARDRVARRRGLRPRLGARSRPAPGRRGRWHHACDMSAGTII